MDYRQIIAESWSYTQKSRKLIFWLGFIPAMITTTFSIGYFTYQFFAFKKSYLFNETDESFFNEVVFTLWDFINNHLSWTVPLVIFAVIFGLLLLLFPTLAKASAFQMIARNRNGQKAGVSDGVKHGVLSFLKLFEYHLLIKTFAFFTILGEMSFAIRNLNTDVFKFLFPIFLIFMFIGLVLTLLFTYADFYIVIDGENVFDSMKKSAKLVIYHWRHTFLITLLMILIGVRIFVQAIMVFMIPTLVILISGYIASIALPSTALIIGGLFGFAFLLIAAYLNGIVDIFSYSVWTFTFLELTSEKELSAREVFVDSIGENKDPQVRHKNL